MPSKKPVLLKKYTATGRQDRQTDSQGSRKRMSRLWRIFIYVPGNFIGTILDAINIVYLVKVC